MLMFGGPERKVEWIADETAAKHGASVARTKQGATQEYAQQSPDAPSSPFRTIGRSVPPIRRRSRVARWILNCFFAPLTSLPSLASLPDRPVRAERDTTTCVCSWRPTRGHAATGAAGDRGAGRSGIPGLVGTQSPRYLRLRHRRRAECSDRCRLADVGLRAYAAAVGHGVAEEVSWLPAELGVGLTTGCQMAHFTCLAAARHRALAEADWDAESDGLFGAPPIRVLVGGAKAHTTVFAALRMLGLGSRRVELVDADDGSHARVRACAACLPPAQARDSSPK